MSSIVGSRLGPYEIVAPLGAGGMGEVYRARDTRLGREVAIKVLPAEFASDPERLRRFEQEARAASALNHPNILTLFDAGRHDGTSYLVTELLEGETLRERLAGGGLPARKAIEIAIDVARGLAAAHGKGIVHRDLKPENLFVTRDGIVKILDFGLARLTLPESGAIAEATTLPGMTATGMVMGTVGYMAPEQVRGELADARCDLFALGCVLYEMVAGRRAFAGATAPEAMSAILRDEPPPLEASGPTGTMLEGLIRRCLEKRPDERFQSARDLGFALEALAAPGGTTSGTIAGRGARTEPWLRRARLAALVAAGVVAGIAVGRSARSSHETPLPPAEFGAGTLVQLTTDPGYEAEPTLSPDGQTVAYVADRDGNFEIYLQQISGGPAINLTRHPAGDVQPSFSPDGRDIAFVSSRSSRSELTHAAPGLPRVGGDIWTMPALGGTPRRIVENGNYPSWSPDGTTIVYVHGTFRDTHIALVPSTGGIGRDLPIDEPFVQRYFTPSFSGDGRWILYQNGDQIEVVSAGGGAPRVLAKGGQPAWGASSTSVLFSNETPGKSRTLWRAPFDLRRGELAGLATPLTFGRGADLGARASRDGSAIVFAAVDETLNLEELPFDAEAGRATGLARELTQGSHRLGFFDASPDGGVVVFAAARGTASHIWRIDPPAPPIQLTLDPRFSDGEPNWSPDGREIAFMRTPAGETQAPSALWMMSADGGSPRPITDGVRGGVAWLSDGRRIVVQRGGQLDLFDLHTMTGTPISGATTRTLFAVDQQSEWVAFQTGERGTIDLAAVPLAGGEPRIVVSTPQEDYHPFFSPSGRWLYFSSDHRDIWRVPGPAQSWRAAPPERVTSFTGNDLYLEEPKFSRDGKKLFYTRGRTTGDLWVLQLGSNRSTTSSP